MEGMYVRIHLQDIKHVPKALEVDSLQFGRSWTQLYVGGIMYQSVEMDLDTHHIKICYIYGPNDLYVDYISCKDGMAAMATSFFFKGII